MPYYPREDWACADCFAPIGHHRRGCDSTRPLNEVEVGDLIVHNHKPWIVEEHHGTELELFRADGERMSVFYSRPGTPVKIDSNYIRI